MEALEKIDSVPKAEKVSVGLSNHSTCITNYLGKGMSIHHTKESSHHKDVWITGDWGL